MIAQGARVSLSPIVRTSSVPYPRGQDTEVLVKHSTHPEIVVRLKRAHGHLASILAMFADGRSCVDLAQQLHAVERAVSNAKRELVNDHLEHCLNDMDRKAAVREFKALSKYL